MPITSRMLRAQLTADGQKIEGNLPGVPFPIPQSGLEVMWNHMIRYGTEFSMEYDVYYVGANGKPVLSTTGTPNPGVAGTTTYDDSFIYNGSPERFTWPLVGKKEMIVPANNFDFTFHTKVEDLLGEKFLDPTPIRYEKRRVWVVDSHLKEGSRHLYSRRTFYIDEESWVAVAGEMYDGRDNLWRVQYNYTANLYDRASGFGSAYGAYDLLQNIYNLNGKPIPGEFKNGVDQGEKYFTPKGMARSGVR